jgi:hypothetical protein
MRTASVLCRALLALAALAPAGCGHAGADNPDQARQVLGAALEAWKAGKSVEAAQGETGIVVGDPQWQAGYKLVRYEVADEARPAGFDLSYPAELWLEDARGQPAHEKAAFTVSTRPSRTVIRAPFDKPPEPLKPRAGRRRTGPDTPKDHE